MRFFQRTGPDAETPPDLCARFTPEQRERLDWAATALVESRGIMMRIAEFVGGFVNQVGGVALDIANKALGDKLQGKVQGIAEAVLWKSYGAATFGMDPERDREPWNWLHKAVVSASGVAGGFLGMPGLTFDLPVTTGMILRSVAEIARAHGEDIASDDCRRACLEVFAFGGPETGDDEAEIGYWSTRAALSQLAIGGLVGQVGKTFGMALSHKVAAQLIPAIGAIAGGGLNFVFMDYYQQMARVHFTIRQIERDSGDAAAVRACFEQRVREIRAARGLRAGRKLAG